jgi:type VI secretion system (T6SS) effector TldE1-like protein
MTYVAATADKIPSGPGVSFSGPIALVIVALTSGAAAWAAYPVNWVSDSASSEDINTSSFDDRFPANSGSNLLLMDLSRPVVQSLPPELEIKFQQAKDQLAQKLQFLDRRAALVEEPTPSSVAAVPVPRPRPVEANLELRDSPVTAQPDNRTLLQKLSDLLPARITLASLSPDGGLLGDGPDLTSLGYDNLTAVYDISARTVYMPNGLKLEAHSGFGRLMDDPGHVSERNVGATPPNVYDLKPRERLFHGVQALRMIPVDGSDTLGRSGLLAHSYMLGANGDSNGCVSIKNYEKFLKAFNNGEIKRLVVVASLGDSVSAARRSVSQS